MKELVEDFKAIAKKDRSLFIWMAVNFLLSIWLFLIPLFNLNSGRAKIWARYSDIDNGYAQSDWWYLLGFSLIAIAMGIGHTLLAARLWTKRGKDLARLFLFISMIILVVGIRFLLNIIGEG
jgi:hydrogenase/urease accessory protein HupE